MKPHAAHHKESARPPTERAAASPLAAANNQLSAPVLAKIVSQRKRLAPRTAPVSPGLRWKFNARSCSRTQARTTATAKYRSGATLWMNRQQPQSCSSTASSESDDTALITIYESDPCQATHIRLELQTNNSKKEGSLDLQRKAPSTTTSESSDYELVSDLSECEENASAVAKGADAMVKNLLSRQTEIIDTSKLVEEGKVEVEYEDEAEVIEEQDHAMVDEYEKGFAYARRLRALLNMDFKEVDRGSIETNFLLIKAHEHPTQKMINRWRNVDMGFSYNDQVRLQKLIDDSRAAVRRKGKKGAEVELIYPDLIRLTVRFRKDNSEKRWKEYLAFRQQQKKQGGNKGGPVPKPNDKYVFAFMDVWSFCVVVFVKQSATVRDIIDPVFGRLGLDRRADFTYTIGCFNNDKRAGKAKVIGVPNLPEEVELYTTAAQLYRKNCCEIYVNDNRCEMFAIFPEYYLPNEPKKAGELEKKTEPQQGKKKKGQSAAQNKSNVQLGTIDEKSSAPASSPGAATSTAPGTSPNSAALLRDEAAAFEKAASGGGKLASPSQRLTISEELPSLG